MPADEFDELLDHLKELGEVLERDLDSQDVTDQIVDLERRIANARVSADRLRELLAEAGGVPDVLAIENELTKREAEIEVMSGQLQVVRDRVDLSTLTVTFTEESASDPEVADDLPSFLRSFKAGGVAVANIGLGLLAVIGFLLPFAPFFLLGWLGWRTYRKRRPKPERVPPAPLPGWSVSPGNPEWVPTGAPPPPGSWPATAARPGANPTTDPPATRSAVDAPPSADEKASAAEPDEPSGDAT